MKKLLVHCSILFGLMLILLACPKKEEPSPQQSNGVNSLSGVNTTTGNNTVAGTNTIGGISTISGTDTTTGINTITGENTVTGGNPNSDTLTCGDRNSGRVSKPYFYGEFDTTFKQNEIKLLDYREFMNQNNINGNIICYSNNSSTGFIIASDTAYKNNCEYRIGTTIGSNFTWILSTLPSIDFSRYSILSIPNTNDTRFYKFHGTKLLDVGSEYRLVKYLAYGTICGILGGPAYSSPSVSKFIVDQKLNIGAIVKEVDIIRLKCITMNTNICNDTSRIETHKILNVK